MDAAARKILSDIKAGRYAPVYLLQGEETYYIDLISKYIEDNVLSESERSFNQVVLYGRDSPVDVILSHAKRFPMMSEYQVVVVREAQDIPDLGKESGQKLLMDYFTRPLPSTLLVLCHKHKSLDKRKELGKKAEQLTTTVTFKKLYENQLSEFADEYIRGKGRTIDAQGLQVLCESVGNDLTRLTNEVDKLLIGKPAGVLLTANDVIAGIGMSREYNIFELQKALIAQDVLRIYRIASFFAANPKKNPAIVQVAFLYGFFSKLLVASGSSCSTEKELVTTLKISPFSARDYMIALKTFSLGKLIENISLLKETDLRLKGVNSGSEDEGQILMELMMRLVH